MDLPIARNYNISSDNSASAEVKLDKITSNIRSSIGQIISNIKPHERLLEFQRNAGII